MAVRGRENHERRVIPRVVDEGGVAAVRREAERRAVVDQVADRGDAVGTAADVVKGQTRGRERPAARLRHLAEEHYAGATPSPASSVSGTRNMP